MHLIVELVKIKHCLEKYYITSYIIFIKSINIEYSLFFIDLKGDKSSLGPNYERHVNKYILSSTMSEKDVERVKMDF